MDAYDMLAAVDITAQIPSSFYTQMESKKWSDRKEALEVIEKATAVSRILNNDLNELVKVLRKTIAKDSNIVVVALAAKCLCQLAQGLRTNFAPYSGYSLPVIFDKFKEKKPNVISILRDAADAAFVGTNIENILEDVIPFLDNKNPQIKSEMSLFLARVFSRYPEQVLNKKTLRPLINSLIKTLSDMDATVRDNSAMAIGTAMKVTGEKLMMTLIADVEPIKITKIKEFCEKAEIITAPVNGQAHQPVAELVNGQQNDPVPQVNGDIEDGEDDEEKMYEMLEAKDIAAQIPSSFYTQMESKKWSDRKEALEIIENATATPKIQNNDFSELVRVLKKTIAKDSNIVVVASAAKCLCQLAQGLRTNFSPHASYSLPVLFDKFKEKKPNVISILRDAADAAFVGTNLETILEDVTLFLDNKNPQIKSEMTLFLTRIFSKYPAQVLNKKTLRPLINSLIKTLSDMDATVRDNSAMAIGTAMKVTGEKLMMTLIADVEPIKIPKIKEFCEKAEVKKVPQSVLNAVNSTAPGPLPTISHPAPPPARSSSATMVRSTSNKKLPQKGVPSKPATTAIPNSNATVKRTATIIKRSTVSKRASGLPQPPPVQTAMHPPPAPVVTTHIQPPPTVIVAPTNISISPQQTVPTSTPARPVFSTTQQVFKPTKSDNFDVVIFNLISDSCEQVLESLVELEESLNNDSENLYKHRMNQIVDLTCLQLIKSVDNQKLSNATQTLTSNGNTQPYIVQKISDFLMKLFAKKHLVSSISQQSIRFLLVQIFTLSQTCISTNLEDDTTVKSLNNLASAVIDGIEPSNMMCILTGLLNDPTPTTSIVEPIKKAIIRSMRSFK